MKIDRIQIAEPLELTEQIASEDVLVLAVAQECRVRFYRVLTPDVLEEIAVNIDSIMGTEKSGDFGGYEGPDLNCQQEDFEGQKPSFVLLVDAMNAGVSDYVIPLRRLLHKIRKNGAYSIAYACGKSGHSIVTAWSDADLRFVVEGTYIPPRRKDLATSVFPDVDTASSHFNEMTGWVTPGESTAIEDFWRIAGDKLKNTGPEPSSAIPSDATERTVGLASSSIKASQLLPNPDKGRKNSVSLKRWVVAGLLAFGSPAAMFQYHFGFNKEGIQEFTEIISHWFPDDTNGNKSDKLHEFVETVPTEPKATQEAGNAPNSPVVEPGSVKKKTDRCVNSASELFHISRDPEYAMRNYGRIDPKPCR